jgi:hypothetical protein
MKAKQDIVFSNEQEIKEMLKAIKDTDRNFAVLIKNEVDIKGEYYTRCRGICYCNENRIELFRSNCKNNKELIRVAIYKYAHHHLAGLYAGRQTEFWECYFDLLKRAESKGVYSCSIDKFEE